MALDTLQQLQQGKASFEQALAFYDGLEPVDADFMLGRWRGEDFNTGHPMDGVLERFGWYGKEFRNAEEVHPLIFFGYGGRKLFLNPALMPLGLALRFPWLNNRFTAAVFHVIKPLMATRKPRARLRMTKFRDKVSATMVYDQLPINDVFRKVNESTVLGIMDMKGMDEIYFFVLRRASSS